MEVSTLIRQRLKELGFEQKDLADAANVTESYISQLLRRKKSPPAADRTDIYDKLGKFLKLPPGELARLAEHQRKHELKKKIEDPPKPLFEKVREMILEKCKADKREELSAIFEKQPFGELERLITQTLVDVVKAVAKKEQENENWLQLVARTGGQSYKDVKASVLELLDAEVLSVSAESCLSILDPLIVSWDIDLGNFALEVTLNRQIASTPSTPMKRFEFVEREAVQLAEEPGLRAFLKDPTLCGDATDQEIKFLRQLRFDGQRRPTALFYYRELQSLRDPLHFRNK
jgi:transcriptional regulator with XRE-family HTH domain